jgi:hypothetical protein
MYAIQANLRSWTDGSSSARRIKSTEATKASNPPAFASCWARSRSKDFSFGAGLLLGHLAERAFSAVDPSPALHGLCGHGAGAVAAPAEFLEATSGVRGTRRRLALRVALAVQHGVVACVLVCDQSAVPCGLRYRRPLAAEEGQRVLRDPRPRQNS